MIAFLREWGALVVPLLLVTALLALVLVSHRRTYKLMAQYAATTEETWQLAQSLEFRIGAQADELDREASARGGSDASLDMKAYLLADYLGLEFVRGKEGGWLLRSRPKGART